jgi:hypothetical protein
MNRRLALAWMLALLLLPGAPLAQGPDAAAVDRARSAREIEDMGGYAPALALQLALRAQVLPDADLELAIALNEARLGKLDSAATRLWGPLLSAALTDTLPLERRTPYFWGRDAQWLNGHFDGWHWTVARARAEVAMRLGRHEDALAAAEIAAAAHPLSGKEWHVLATCQARAGRLAEARASAARAARLDPTLPEPVHLGALIAWREGRRDDAQRGFREAIRRDTTWTAPAVALVRSRLPVAPDSLPSTFFSGIRRIAELSAPDGPKLEHFRQMDHPAVLRTRVEPDIHLDPDPPPLVLSVLLDPGGRPVLHDVPWLPAGAIPEDWVSAVVRALHAWEYAPAMQHGQPQYVWVTVEYRQSGP